MILYVLKNKFRKVAGLQSQHTTNATQLHLYTPTMNKLKRKILM